MTVLHPIVIPNWHPATLNQLLKAHWGEAAKLKRKDRDVVYYSAKEAATPKADGKRRVHLAIILKPRQRAADPDAYHKSLLDALVKAGLLRNDSHHWCELTSPTFRRGTAKAWGTVITLEEL